MRIRQGPDEPGIPEAVECLREQTVEGRSRDVACDAKGCQFPSFSAIGVGDDFECTPPGCALLQLRLRARNVEGLAFEERDFMVRMERKKARATTVDKPLGLLNTVRRGC